MKSMSRLLTVIAGAFAATTFAAHTAPPDDTLVIALSADAATLDPAQLDSRDNINIAQHIFQTLYAQNGEGKFVPQAADSYSVSDDGLEYTFKLKPNMKCEDGEPLDGEAAAYSFMRPADPAGKFTGDTTGYVFPAIGFKKAEAINATEFKVTIAHRTPTAFALINEVFLHCKAGYEKMSPEEAVEHPIASGPYKLISWDHGSQIVLQKWKEPATFKTIIWRIIPEASTRSAELIAGNVDIITNVAPDQIDAINNSGSSEVKAVQGTRRIYVGFNTSKDFASTPGGAAIQKKDVRQALQYAVDVPTICKQLLSFACTRATGPVNPPEENHSLQPYPYDPIKAEKMLDDAGYPRGADGVRFNIVMQGPRGRYLNDVNVEMAIGQYLNDIGVKTDVQPMEWASVYSPLVGKKAAGPLFFIGSGGSLGNAPLDLSIFSTPDASTNNTNWTNPDFFAGWDKVNNAKADAERRSAIDAMLQTFYEDPPWLLLYFQPDFYGVSKRVDFTPPGNERVYLFDTKLTK
ncbi:ABC transporter substrate-binding protein [Mesorhizobium sp. WSM4887]|uniref:ABC transporter substrate-binding protein n=1 Tax=Mesorhizobium sp. WSM4887 TaxID=3038543 RepID=UPI0024180E39|nr:ABC transporter substrate-binding protein [Mesorhizobium sp. WSM4887]MDG4889782.1 ABC transporter substrate-binding protein [Mesorhizobium sp. WSM4887]